LAYEHFIERSSGDAAVPACWQEYLSSDIGIRERKYSRNVEQEKRKCVECFTDCCIFYFSDGFCQTPMYSLDTRRCRVQLQSLLLFF